MPSFASLLALAAPLMVLGAPLKRDTATNVLVLKFADVLEQFESQFYQQALVTFQETDFIEAGFVDAQVPIQQFIQIQSDEATHQSTLEAAIQSLGDSPISNCSFNFGSALNDVSTMAATARVVENLGVAAYLGAAHLIDDPVLLTAAGSILTVEARHQTILNVLSNGVSIPQAFDLSLLPNEVLAIASQFISGCDLGITANQPLTITNSAPAQPGTLLTFSSPALNSSTDGLFCQMLLAGMPTSLALPLAQCVVPQGIEGPVGIFITADGQPLNNNVRDRAGQAVLAGPTMAFIDTQTQLLSQLVLAGSTNSSDNGVSVSTSTISPAQASSIIASASAAPTDGSSTASASDSSASAIATDGSSSVSATDGAAPPSATDSSAASASSGAVSPVTTAVAPTATESDNTVVSAAGTRNLATGAAANGAINVDGWQPDAPLATSS